jgi:hypothetical protein
MPRGGSRGSRGPSRSPPPRSSFNASRPQPAHQPSTPQTQSTGMMGGIGSTIMTGMAFGAGSEVAHQAVRGIMGGGSHQGQHQVTEQLPQQYSPQYSNLCQMEIQKFSYCLQTNDEVSNCQSYSDMLKQCKKSNNLI